MAQEHSESMESALPLLSLCVPTYNRAALLDQALQAILVQAAAQNPGLLEVLVLDNASSDETPAVVEEKRRHFSQVCFRAVRHLENIGMDNNFLQSMLLARGKFVLLLSDDDVLLPGAVDHLLTLIQAHSDYDGFCLNVRSFERDPNEEAPNWLKLPQDVVLENRDAVLELIRGHITYLSIVAFNKSRVLGKLMSGHYLDKVGTYFLQCYVFLDALAEGNGVAVVARPLIAQRVDNAHHLNFFRVFVTEFHALMAYAEAAGFSPRAIRQSKDENLIEVRHFVSRVFIYDRQTALWSSRRDGISRLFRAFGLRPYLWLVVIPLMFFPRSLRPLVHTVRRLLGRPEVESGQGAGQTAGPHMAEGNKTL